MNYEANRLKSFARWPHKDYKLATPAKLAEAGFVYQPAAEQDDRCVCAFCNVTLIGWEPQDDPWNEHRRHSPLCPFLQETSSNVPLLNTTTAKPVSSTESLPASSLRSSFLNDSSLSNEEKRTKLLDTTLQTLFVQELVLSTLLSD
eukprot:GILJ01004933.1.p1 GENE.GILJ01004933.1~~GILJ01004933.1.p1  ORF type:complete len:146 (-),score=15.36 GILJ01004933.1:276-713(-)